MISRIMTVGLVSITKRLFYLLFRDAFKAAFTIERIKHTFEKPRIWLFNPAIVIDIIKKPIIIEPNIALGPRTLLTSRAVRRIHRQYKLDHSESKLELILRGHERLATQHSINNYIINRLREAFQIEKKKRQKSRRLNLISKEDDRGPQFFSPSQVQATRKRLAEKDDEEAAERQLMTEEKARKALEKEQKEIEKKERTRKRQEARIEKARLDADRKMKAAEKKVEIEARKALIVASKASKLASKLDSRASKASTKSNKGKRKLVESTIEVGSTPVAKRVAFETSRGRAVITPARFVQNL